MAIYKVIVAPLEEPDAWPRFREQGIVAIGYPERRDDQEPVRTFRRIKAGDWVVAHLPAKRVGAELARRCGGDTFVIVGAGTVTRGYRVETDKEKLKAEGWNRPFRRQLSIDWQSASPERAPELGRGRAHRVVILLPDDLGAKILRKLGVGGC